MARQKTRATTLQQKFGFRDRDLTTATHDGILVWLDSELERIAQELLAPRGWSSSAIRDKKRRVQSAVDSRTEELKQKLEKGEEYWGKDYSTMNQELSFWGSYVLLEPPACPLVEVEETKWEHAITTGKSTNPYVVGFIDLLAYVTIPCLELHDISWQRNWTVRGESVWRYVVCADTPPTWIIEGRDGLLAFEVKSSIRSVGEVIRQIRFYQEYEKSMKFVIVSPDDKHAGILQRQGIGFVKYPGMEMSNRQCRMKLTT